MPASSDCAASVRSTSLRADRLYPAIPHMVDPVLEIVDGDAVTLCIYRMEPSFLKVDTSFVTRPGEPLSPIFRHSPRSRVDAALKPQSRDADTGQDGAAAASE